jgi:phosphoesterase RecJ-like protein
MHNIESLRLLLNKPQHIVITTHHKPDGDALGSSLALYHYFTRKGHKATVVSPTDYPDFLHWMPGENTVINYELEPHRSTKLISEAALIVCLDFNKLYRINELGAIIDAATAPKLLIDHHPEPDSFADFNLHRITACSTCELVYDFILLMDDEQYINTEIATCLYTGILTDTDRFRVPTTTPHVHRITARLLEFGVDMTNVYQHIYETYPEYKLRFFGFCINERMDIIPELQTGIIAIDAADLRQFGIKTGDTEGLVNFPLQLKDVRLAAIIIERPDQVKLSFRSKGNVDVNALARDHFEGGGHKNASGGKSALNVQETKQNLIAILARQKNYFFD